MKRTWLAFAASFAASCASLLASTLTPVEYNPVGIPYAWDLTIDDNETVETAPDHVGAWSWDEDGFPATARGWTHTSKWVKLDLAKPSRFTLTLESLANVAWPGSGEPERLAGTNLYPSFSLYRGWDTDAGLGTNTDGTTIDQDHTFNNRGNVEWAEDVTYLDHLENSETHAATRTWTLPAGRYTINLGGNSPATVAEGRQGYKATFATSPATSIQVVRSGDSVKLVWVTTPQSVKVYQSIAVNGPWEVAPGEPIVAGGNASQSIPISGAKGFFRLQTIPD